MIVFLNYSIQINLQSFKLKQNCLILSSLFYLDLKIVRTKSNQNVGKK